MVGGITLTPSLLLVNLLTLKRCGMLNQPHVDSAYLVRNTFPLFFFNLEHRRGVFYNPPSHTIKSEKMCRQENATEEMFVMGGTPLLGTAVCWRTTWGGIQLDGSAAGGAKYRLKVFLEKIAACWAGRRQLRNMTWTGSFNREMPLGFPEQRHFARLWFVPKGGPPWAFNSAFLSYIHRNGFRFWTGKYLACKGLVRDKENI